LLFVKVGADPNLEYLSDGISDSDINNLAGLPQPQSEFGTELIDVKDNHHLPGQ
jgi:hypothetical protein